MIQGVITEEPARIESEITKFYQKLYTETRNWRPTSLLANGPVLTKAEKEILQENFEEGEVLKCLKMCY